MFCFDYLFIRKIYHSRGILKKLKIWLHLNFFFLELVTVSEFLSTFKVQFDDVP